MQALRKSLDPMPGEELVMLKGSSVALKAVLNEEAIGAMLDDVEKRIGCMLDCAEQRCGGILDAVGQRRDNSLSQDEEVVCCRAGKSRLTLLSKEEVVSLKELGKEDVICLAVLSKSSWYA